MPRRRPVRAHTVVARYEAGQYVARCTCGWVGPPRYKEIVAEADGKAHFDRAQGA